MRGNVRLPRGEIVWVTYLNTKHEPKFMVTSKQNRDFYFLYEVSASELKKLGKARSPLEFESKYEISKALAK